MVACGVRIFMGGHVSDLLPANAGSDEPAFSLCPPKIIDFGSIALMLVSGTVAFLGIPAILLSTFLLLAWKKQ